MTTAEQLFKNIEFFYENIYNLLVGFQQATTSATDINIPIKVKKFHPNGIDFDIQTEQIKITSFDSLFNELKRLDNNFKSLTNEDNISYLLNSDGSISQIAKTSYMNAEYLQGFSDVLQEADCIIDKDYFIKNLLYPNIKIPVELHNSIKSDIRCRVFDISFGWEELLKTPTEELTILKLKYLQDNGIIIANDYEVDLKPEKQRVNFFGSFNVINVDVDVKDSNNIALEFDSVKYEGLNTFGVVIDLKNGDILVDKNGLSKYQITDINILTKRLKVKRIAGNTLPKIGVGEMLFNQVLPTEKNIVGVPVQPNKKMVVFLSTQNYKNISYPSRGIRFDSAKYRVVDEKKTYTIDEYFAEKVTNFSAYFESLLKEQSIPYSLGLKPKKVLLDQRNFNVIQVNKHITNEKSRQRIETLNSEKQKIKSRIEFINTNISTIQNELDTLKFKSQNEKQYRLTKISELRNEKNILEQNLLNVSRDIDNNAIDNGIKNVKPKYKVLGAWEHLQPLFSPQTREQHVIKYEVQYRYLSKNLDVVDSTNMKLITEGKEITLSYSSWLSYPTRALKREKTSDGTLVWETIKYNNSDEININQLAISISENESVEIRVRAISEAGYPLSLIEGEWSDIIRIDFPQNLIENNLKTLINRNDTDLKTAEFNNILKNSGLLEHISGQIQESEKLFYHKADDIASGFFTPEQKNIPLRDFLQTLYNEINLLKKSEENKNIIIEIVDFNKEVFSVTNNSTIELNAGAYTDSVNLLNTKEYGTIIKKSGLIRIKNVNNGAVEIKSLAPSPTFDSSTAPQYFNVGVRMPESLVQKSGQVFYFRNVDVTGQNEDVFKLVKQRLSDTTTNINPDFIDDTAIADHKNIVYYNGTNVQICKFLNTYVPDNFVAFTTEHPLYKSSSPNDMKGEFERIKKMTATTKALQYQDEYNNGDKHIGFSDMDFYMVGGNSCGAFLYPIISNPNKISVIGNSTTSTLILQTNSEILIPFVFEYRMCDRLGNINGKRNQELTTNFEYSKKIGVDMLINNDLFKFDIHVKAKFNSDIKPIEKLNINSITSKYIEENKTKLIP